MNITLDRLKYFLEVAKLEHVGLASKSLGISASAISSAISILESEYGCSLFERSHQRIQLNEKGQWLKEQVEPILEQLESLGDQISGNESGFKGHLNVGGSFFLATHYLRPILHKIQKEHPGSSVELSPLRSTQVTQEVINGALDYGVCFSPSGNPNLEKTVLYTGTLKIVVAKNHPIVKLIKNKTFKHKLLNNYPAAVHKFAPGIDYRETNAFEAIGIEPDIRNFYHSEDLAIESVLESEMWAVVPDIVAHYYGAKLVSVPLPQAWKASFEICSIYRKSMKGRMIFQKMDELLTKLV